MDRRTGGSLARLGFSERRAEAILTDLGWWKDDRPASGAEHVMWALARSPDPDLAVRSLERLFAAVTDAPTLDAELRDDVGLRGRLLALLGSSTALGDHLIAHPDRWHRLAGSGVLPASDPAVAMLTAVGADPAGPPAGVSSSTSSRDDSGDATAPEASPSIPVLSSFGSIDSSDGLLMIGSQRGREASNRELPRKLVEL